MKFYKKIDYFIITGILIGILAFGVLYGYSTLDVSYDGWIYHTYASESDVIQHYAGWVNYRNSPWDFPIAKASILGEGGTVISFTDSIPIVAIICKNFFGIAGNFSVFRHLYFSLFCPSRNCRHEIAEFVYR